MINESEKIIFFHIPKAAGLSVGNYFGTYKEGDKTDHRTLYEVLPLRIVLTNYRNKIDSYLLKKFFKNSLIDRTRISEKKFIEYSKIAVVRNPLSRVVSWYKNVITDPNHIRAHGGDKNIMFDEFVAKYINNTWALRSQLDWITTPDQKFKVDKIIKFESINEDVDTISNEINYKPTSELPEYHKADDYSWQSYYDNKRTKELVVQKFSEEINYLGYN